MFSIVPQTRTTNQGGPFVGYSAPQTMSNYKDSEMVMGRRVLRDAWNNVNVQKTINGYGRITTPFRAVNNLGDYLGRKNYVCGGANEVNASKPGMKRLIRNANSQCDGTGVGGSSCNPKFVSDSSDYITYKKQAAINSGYNKIKNGGVKSSFQNLPQNFYFSGN